MSEWKKYRLGDFAEINPNERLPKGKIAKKIAMEVLQPFTKRITSYSWEEYKGGAKFRNGDTIMARITPSLENGKTSYVDILDYNEVGFGSTEFIVFREKENISDKHFIYYLTTSPIIRETAIKSMTGSSGRQRVQTDVLKEYLFDAPPLPEQRAIAEVLSSLDDKIDLLHRQNKTMEQMAETLFRQWFIEETKEDWEEVSLSKEVNIKYGKNLPTSKLLTIGFPVFGANGLIGYYDKYLYKEPQVLISCRGAASGKVIVTLPFSYITNNSLILEIKKDSNMTFEFLKYYSLSADFTAYISGSAQPQITIENLSNVTIVLPRKKLLIEKFTKIVNPTETKILNNLTQIRTLEKLRNTLLPKLMSGEVRVRMDGKI